MQELSVLLRKLAVVLTLEALLKVPRPLLSVHMLEDLRKLSRSNVNVLCELRVNVNRPERNDLSVISYIVHEDYA